MYIMFALLVFSPGLLEVNATGVWKLVGTVVWTAV